MYIYMYVCASMCACVRVYTYKYTCIDCNLRDILSNYFKDNAYKRRF